MKSGSAIPGFHYLLVYKPYAMLDFDKFRLRFID